MTSLNNVRQITKNISTAKNIEQINFDMFFNLSLDDTIWPHGLKKINLGMMFNQPIEDVKWPDTLEEIYFPSSFNQSIENVKWPNSLKKLYFAHDFNHNHNTPFNQPINKVVWPDSLEEIYFNSNFNQSIKDVKWPKSIKKIHFGFYSDKFTTGLRYDKIKLETYTKEYLEDVKWPDSLEELYFNSNFIGPFNFNHSLFNIDNVIFQNKDTLTSFLTLKIVYANKETRYNKKIHKLEAVIKKQNDVITEMNTVLHTLFDTIKMMKS